MKPGVQSAAAKKYKNINHLQEMFYWDFIKARIADIIDCLNLVVIFSMLLHPSLDLFLQTKLGFILFPLTGVMSVVNMAMAWRLALNKLKSDGSFKDDLLFQAITRTISMVVISSAIIIGYTALVPMYVASVLFVSNLILQTFIQMSAAMYYWGKSQAENNTEEQAKTLQSISKTILWVAVGLGLAAGGVAMVRLLGMLNMAPIPALGGLVLASVNINGLWNEIKSHNEAAEAEEKEERASFNQINYSSYAQTVSALKAAPQPATPAPTLTSSTCDPVDQELSHSSNCVARKRFSNRREGLNRSGNRMRRAIIWEPTSPPSDNDVALRATDLTFTPLNAG